MCLFLDQVALLVVASPNGWGLLGPWQWGQDDPLLNVGSCPLEGVLLGNSSVVIALCDLDFSRH